MTVSELEGDELLAGKGGFDVGCRCCFDRGTVSDTDEAEDAGVAFGDAEDVGVEAGAGGS